MSSTVVASLTQMMESLPAAAQARVTDQLREFILDLQDELQ